MSEFNEDHEHNSDPLDLSVANQDRILRAELSVRKPEGPKFTGFCLDDDCREPLQAPRRWCNSDCRESWERDKSAKARGK